MGIDGGTQSAKVSIYNLTGQLVCSASQALKPLTMPAPNIAEHPADDVWDAIANACQQAMQQFPHQPEQIMAVGLCTIRCCQAALDAEGNLVTPMLSWMDKRMGEVYHGSDERVRYLTSSSGYITYRLTGERKDTAANYEGMWPLDKNTWRWSENPALLAQYNIQTEQLFELVMPAQMLGTVTEQAAQRTGLPTGLPVIATANDKAVEALGAGLPKQTQTALISLGTYIGGMVYGDEYQATPQHFFSNLACIPQHYLYESAGVRQGMGAVSWYRHLLGQGIVDEARALACSPEQLLNQEAAQIPAGCDGLITLADWLAPNQQPHKRGVMLGFHIGHRRAHLYRSLLEAIAITMKNHLDAMCAELGFIADNPLEQLIISGGGANSDVFMQIFADVFNLPVHRNQVNDAAGLGAAICAAVAVNAYDSFDSATQAMVRRADSFVPIKQNVVLYQRLNQEVFQQLSHATDTLLQSSYGIFNSE